jgi:hypothetical protein
MMQSLTLYKGDILAILVSSFLQGGDKPTLFALAVGFGVDRDFRQECARLENQRVITLEKGK